MGGKKHQLQPIKQEFLLQNLKPLILENGSKYRKIGLIEARLAIDGEVILSVTHSGFETMAIAKKGQIVARNCTSAREKYLLELEVFAARYKVEMYPTDYWQKYRAEGKIQAISIDKVLRDFLGVPEAFSIIAPWGEEQCVRERDFMACILPSKNEIYRIGYKEFSETYEFDSD